jgi:thiol-disulfide isomerase/thioredoxin
MNTRVIVIVAIGILVLVGGFLFINNMNGEKSMQGKNTVMQKEDVVMMEKNDTIGKGETMDNASYLAYSKAALDGGIEKKRVLFFYANWCPTCRPADANFNENVSKIPDDVTLIRVNYNDTDTDQEEKDLAEKYGITYQHTFVQIDQQGNEVAKWNGGQIDELLANIK